MLRILLSALLIAAAFPAHADSPPPQTPDWPFAESDLPADPSYRYGTLENGMRYVIRANGTPAGQGMVQFWVDAGSISEQPDELGYAHFIEHMAFNGSTNVPEGEMIKLLEREGLAFGADTNAATGFDITIYKLNLPRNDAGLLGTALMLMRETASELNFASAAVEREKGVVLSELRVRDTYSWHNTVGQLQFLYPEARFSRRFPIGTAEGLRGASSESLRGLWQRLYRPENSAIIVVGEFDPDQVEVAIRKHFSDWQGEPKAALPDAGPIKGEFADATDIFLDPALPERVVASRHGVPIDLPDTIANRQTTLLAGIGYRIINRRFQRIARTEDPPFRSAGIGTTDVFKAARTTNLIVDSSDGEWQGALAEAQAEYRLALQFGFTEAEVAEQIANLRTALENSAAGSSTRSNPSLVNAALALLKSEIIPTTPISTLARFEAYAPQITPENVLAALKIELVPLENPLIRFSGRTAPEGGGEALRDAWGMGMNVRLEQNVEQELDKFAYTDFGEPGIVVSDTTELQLGIRQITFANGLRLNLKPTELQQDRISVQLNVDGGKLLNSADNPLATAMVSVLSIGGLGEHSFDELQSILAGRSVSFAIRAADETFRMGGTTTPRDLELQLQLLAATLSDPGYRPPGQAQYRHNMENFFARRNATPESALRTAMGGILSDRDPRFTLQPEADYLALTFAGLRGAISDRLAHGALELALVGDFEGPEVIAAVARTLGALPTRESAFGTYEESRRRTFTHDRSVRTLRHEGSADQALLRMTWPTRDHSDFAEHLRLELLERVMRIELTDTLREELGQTYSPRVNASQSRTYSGYGTFSLTSSVDTAQLDVTRAAVLETLADLIARPVPSDVLLRARQPLLEAFDNALKSNAGWINLVGRAQTKPERITRFKTAKAMLAALNPDDIRAIAARYLTPDERVEIVVLPRQD